MPPALARRPAPPAALDAADIRRAAISIVERTPRITYDEPGKIVVVVVVANTKEVTYLASSEHLVRGH